ncbi:MAG: hypothetical protein IPP29_13770 [Bacteroidetes bacterium]|nr:hypothetical protein [Bacteroidota bacterium]
MFSILSIAVQFCNAQGLQTFHSFTGTTILGDTVSFSQWAGKKLLIVNTASFCGYTPQFADLQALDYLSNQQFCSNWFSLQRFWRTGSR